MWNTIRILKHLLRVLERLARRFREEEEDVDQHAEIEDAKNEVDFPADRGKSRRYEGSKGGIEGPIGAGGERDGLAADTKWIQFRRVYL